MNDKSVICFGEVLWDLLPDGKVAGGAPMNVAYHLNNFGVQTRMVSRIGDDGWGKELMQFLQAKDISTDLIQTDPDHQTGIVNVTFDEKGGPDYDIVQPVAWDFIHLDSKILDAVERSDLLVFGSLAARGEVSRKTLLQMLESARLKVFDVNLRPPFYRQDSLEQLLCQADIVKMNDDELDIISAWYTRKTGELDKMELVKKHFDLTGVLMTKGKSGASYLDDDGLHEQTGFPVKVADTIGSGDSFLAGFLSQWLAGRYPLECLRFACATGALVATHRGGTPAMDTGMVYTFLEGRRQK